MRSNTTFSINFFVRKQKSCENEGRLYCRITLNSQSLEISLKRKVPMDKWNNAKSRLKGSTIIAKQINRFIQETRLEVYNAYDSLRKSKSHFTVQSIKAKYLNEEPDQMTLLKAFQYHNDKMTSDLAPGTIKHYKTSFSHLSRFIQSELKQEDVYLSELSYSFLTKFEYYLRSYKPVDHQKPIISNNTVMKHIQRLRKVVSMSIKLEWLDKDPFLKFKCKFTKSERTFLSEQDLATIENKVFSVDRLSFIQDLFIFSCYTGLSYIDAVQLTLEDIVMGIDGSKWIYSNRQKNKAPIRVPLLQKAEDLIHKYKDSQRSLHHGTIFPVISNQKVNSYLKEIATLCGIKSNLTFHVARHTFATTVTLVNGISIEAVSGMLGHSKISTTQIYGKIVDRRISEEMNKLRDKLNHKSSKAQDSKGDKPDDNLRQIN